MIFAGCSPAKLNALIAAACVVVMAKIAGQHLSDCTCVHNSHITCLYGHSNECMGLRRLIWLLTSRLWKLSPRVAVTAAGM